MPARETTNPAPSPSDAPDASPLFDEVRVEHLSPTRVADDLHSVVPLKPESPKNFAEKRGADILVGMGLVVFLVAGLVLVAGHWAAAAVCGGTALLTVVVAIRVKDLQSLDVELRGLKMTLKVLLSPGKTDDQAKD